MSPPTGAVWDGSYINKHVPGSTPAPTPPRPSPSRLVGRAAARYLGDWPHRRGRGPGPWRGGVRLGGSHGPVLIWYLVWCVFCGECVCVMWVYICHIYTLCIWVISAHIIHTNTHTHAQIRPCRVDKGKGAGRVGLSRLLEAFHGPGQVPALG